MRAGTSELTGIALRWMVAECEGTTVVKLKESDSLFYGGGFNKFAPDTDWNQGGPIIEREGICLKKGHSGWWIAKLLDVNDEEHFVTVAPTPLIAAMRCYVASKLGEEVDVPDELLTP